MLNVIMLYVACHMSNCGFDSTESIPSIIVLHIIVYSTSHMLFKGIVSDFTSVRYHPKTYLCSVKMLYYKVCRSYRMFPLPCVGEGSHKTLFLAFIS